MFLLMTISNDKYKIQNRSKINLSTPAPRGVNWFSSLPMGSG